MVRLLNALTADESKMEQLLNQMTKMARKLLVASNIETFSLCATAAKKSDEFEQFVSALPTPNATLDQFRHCDQIVFPTNVHQIFLIFLKLQHFVARHKISSTLPQKCIPTQKIRKFCCE